MTSHREAPTLASPVLTPPARLVPEDLEAAADPITVSIPPAVREAAARSHDFLLYAIETGRDIYGSTTGFGPLAGHPGQKDPAAQCENLLAHLEVGQGPDLEPALARAALLARLWTLARGRSGVHPQVLDTLAAMLATRFAPAIPELGSLGASGDLAPLAHAVRALQGRGHAYHDGQHMPADQALSAAGLRPIELSGRDALGLVNGTPVTAAAAGLAVAQLARCVTIAVGLTGLLCDMLGTRPDFAHPALFEALGHPDTQRTAAILWGHMDGLEPDPDRPLQEPYSLRCSPHLIGAATASLRHARQIVTDDLNGIADNPLFFPEQDLICHGGNFFGQQAAFAADLLSLTATQLANLAERQLDLMVDPHRNGGLTPVLAEQPGRDHGVQGVQLAATALVAAMRRSATPASMQSIPTNHHNQDVVPFGTQAAINALNQVRTLRLLHGSLAVTLRQAAHVGARTPTSSYNRELLDALSSSIPPAGKGVPLAECVRTAATTLDTWAKEKE